MTRTEVGEIRNPLLASPQSQHLHSTSLTTRSKKLQNDEMKKKFFLQKRIKQAFEIDNAKKKNELSKKKDVFFYHLEEKLSILNDVIFNFISITLLF